MHRGQLDRPAGRRNEIEECGGTSRIKPRRLLIKVRRDGRRGTRRQHAERDEAERTEMFHESLAFEHAWLESGRYTQTIWLPTTWSDEFTAFATLSSPPGPGGMISMRSPIQIAP